MIDPASPDAVVARLRSSNWSDPQELGQALAVALSALFRQPTYRRGLHDGVLADKNGGTSIKVGDNAVGRVSQSLQPPQLGFVIKHGVIGSRRQARIETEVKTLPGKVLSVEGSGEDAVMTIAVIGDKPIIAIDETTGQNKPGDLIQGLADANIDVNANTYQVSLTGGIPFTGDADEDHGTSLPSEGQTMQITIAKQYERSAVWSERSRRISPRVHEIETHSGATAVNGFCCKEVTTGGGGGGGGS